MFNKEEYWKNRKAGLRGQGVAYNPIGGMAITGGKKVSKKAILKNTKRARKAAA